MIVTDYFIYIHLFRSGGTFINELLTQHLDHAFLGYHRPRAMIPPPLQGLRVIGNVRNPWDWYVSVYHHAVNFGYPNGANTFLNRVLNFQKHDFKDAIRKMLDTRWMTPRDTAAAEGYFPFDYDWKATRTDNLRKVDFQSYLASGLGFNTWLFDHMYAVNGSYGSTYFCKSENLRGDFKNALFSMMDEVPDELLKNLAQTEKKNAMSGTNSYFQNIPVPRDLDYRKYYDDDLAALVFEKDRKIIERFGYTF